MLNIITGGAGFIGRELVAQLLAKHEKILVFDDLTYASRREDLPPDSAQLEFVKLDICETVSLRSHIKDFLAKSPTEDLGVFHLAAESHVDRSIQSGVPFMRTNVLGTQSLLEAVAGFNIKKLVHVSTDEVYGSVLLGESDEESNLNPSSPYAASKAASDLVVKAFGHTHGLPYNITRCANNYGGGQLPEKLIPRLVHKAIQGNPLPIYGDGSQIREWIHVSDHVAALLKVMSHGRDTEIYNIGTSQRMKNLDIAKMIIEESQSDSVIEFVDDRKGHDSRYALNSQKIVKELDWIPDTNNSLQKTVKQIASHLRNNGVDSRFHTLEKLHDK
jgi:dTDP-glucose 4,6-dehydratase